MSIKRGVCLAILLWVALTGSVAAGKQMNDEAEADRMPAKYFHRETKKLQDGCLNDIKTLEDWKTRRPVYQQQLLEMLGLDPLPEKTPLQATTTGVVEHEQFTVENLHFQSRPGLYVTANLYLPKGLAKPAPAILYVCGHGPVKKDGISYGCKVAYQQHGEWFARHGYVCLTIDTLQLGEIEGIHHGTYRYNMWWWNCRGYTPAGVEAWNCVRALDYLETRKEVDANRIGVTGRSGGGAYSWWIAAIDDRIKVAVPVAGITDLQNHVVDGCVGGHCDCMFIVNTYRWDYPLVAALVAPRPLLISNSDKDTIFPLDGVLRVHEKVRRIYELYGQEKNLGLHITEGPHKDTQELQVHAFTWFDRFLKGESSLIREPAEPLLQPEQLRVFDKLPCRRDQHEDSGDVRSCGIDARGAEVTGGVGGPAGWVDESPAREGLSGVARQSGGWTARRGSSLHGTGGWHSSGGLRFQQPARRAAATVSRIPRRPAGAEARHAERAGRSGLEPVALGHEGQVPGAARRLCLTRRRMRRFPAATGCTEGGRRHARVPLSPRSRTGRMERG